jgi:hypothetical protein
MSKTPMRPHFAGAYPGTNVTPDANVGPGLAPQVLVAPSLVAAPTFENLPRALVGNPTTGEVGFPDKWESIQHLRRRSSWRANSLTADFRSDGGEGAITFAGTTAPPAAGTQLSTMPRVRLTTSAALNASKTATTNLGLYRWRWDPTAGFWIGTVAFTNARYWLAMTNISLDQTAAASIAGAGSRVVAFCMDGISFGDLNWRAVTFAGSTPTITDTGISGVGMDNTMFMPRFEIDTNAAVARFYLYNRGTGTDHGLVATHAFAPGVSDLFGLECVVQVVNNTAALSLDINEFFCEHAP